MNPIISVSNNTTNISSMNFSPGGNINDLGLPSFNQKKHEVAVLETDNGFTKYLFNQRDKIAGLKTSNNFTKYPINQKKKIAVLEIDNNFTGTKYNNIPRSKRLRAAHKKGNKRSSVPHNMNLIFQGKTTRLTTPESTTTTADSIYPPRFRILMNLFNACQVNSLSLKETDFYPEFLDEAVQVIDQILINLRSPVHLTEEEDYCKFVMIIKEYISLNIQQDPQRDSKIDNIMINVSSIFLEYFFSEKSTTILELIQSTTVPETTVKQTKQTAATSTTIPESTTTTEPKITQLTTIPQTTVKQTKQTAATSTTIPESTTTTEPKITQLTNIQRGIALIGLSLFAIGSLLSGIFMFKKKIGSLLSGIFMFKKKRRYKRSLHLANNLKTSQRQGHTQV